MPFLLLLAQARLKLSRLHDVGIAPFHVAFVLFRDAAILEGGGVFWIELNRLVVVGDGAIELTLGTICIATVVEG